MTKDMKPTKHNLMLTIGYFPVEYKISFQVNPKSYDGSDWKNVLQFSSGSGSGGSGPYGSRNPGIWASTDKWRVASAVNSFLGYGYVVEPTNVYNINEWIQIDVSQIKDDKGKYNYSVMFNGELVHSVINTQPKNFSAVKVYVSNPWHDALNSVIRSLSCLLLDDKG